MEAKSPQKAADIANGVAQAFIDYSLAQKQKILLQAQGWNEKMMDDLRDKLDRQKADIDDFLKQKRPADLSQHGWLRDRSGPGDRD